MEDKYVSIISWVQACVTAIFVVGATLLFSWIKSHNYSTSEATALVIIGSVLGTKLSELMVKSLIHNMKLIRYMIYRRSFIEGRWFDVVLSPTTKLVREYGLIEIDFEKGQFLISGILFDCAHRRIGDYSSNLARFDGKKLEYGYSRHAEHEDLEEASGLGEYNFTKEKPYPLTFKGSFFDPDLDQKVLIRGIRITDKKIIKKIDSKDPEDQAGVVHELAKKFLLEFPEYKLSITACENMLEIDSKRDENENEPNKAN